VFDSREINGRGEWISTTDFLAPDQALNDYSLSCKLLFLK